MSEMFHLGLARLAHFNVQHIPFFNHPGNCGITQNEMTKLTYSTNLYNPIKSGIQKVVLLISLLYLNDQQQETGDLSWDPLSFLWSLGLMVPTLLNMYFLMSV